MAPSKISYALAQKILEIVDLDAPRSDVQSCAEALAFRVALATQHESEARKLIDWLMPAPEEN